MNKILLDKETVAAAKALWNQDYRVAEIASELNLAIPAFTPWLALEPKNKNDLVHKS